MPRTATAARRPDPRDTVAAPPAGFAPLGLHQVEAQTDPGSFDRGRSYYRTGKIYDGVRRGATLRARCRGSSGGPYRVEATVATAEEGGGRNPVAFGCDCPRGGFCKHVVALLLTWVYAPETFEARPPVAELLAGKSQAELVALVELLLREAPELEDLVALPMPVALPDAAADPDTPGDEAAIRRLVEAAVDRDDEGDESGRWGYDRNGAGYGEAVDAGKLERLAALGEAYADAGRWRNALSVGATLIEQIAPEFDETLLDEAGALKAVLAICDRVLAQALDAQGGLAADRRLTPTERERLIDALIDLWEADAAAGGQGLAEEGPAAVARNASPDEQRGVGQRLRGMIRTQATPFDGQDWLNRAALGFLSRLAGEAGLSAEELLAEYKGAELWEEAAETLLRTDRVEEAIALAARRLASAVVLARFADRLVATGEPGRIDQAIKLVESCLWEREGRSAQDDSTLQQWLERRYAAHGNPQKALETARRRFKAAPSTSTYEAIKAAARLPDQPDDPWPTLRPALIAVLHKRGDTDALIAIHLDEGDVGAALAALEQGPRNRSGGYAGDSPGWGASLGGASPEVRVAGAAEHDFPDDAIAIYRRLAERQIAARSRPRYQEAARFMARIKQVSDDTGRRDQWPVLIGDLRQRHKRLRALREELDALDLR